MPPHFDFPEARTDLWMPLPRFNPDSLGDRTNHYLFMVGRVKPTATIGRARVEAATIAHRIMQQYADRFDPKYPLIPRIRSVADELVGSTQPYLLALLGAAGFVLLIACSNVANLLLVRGEARQKEMALRSALGASGSRLAGQMLVESALLAIVGGALGLAFAWMGTRLLLGAAPSSIPRLDAIGIDWRVLLFTAGVVVATGLMIGLVPAWRIARGASAEALKESGRVVSTHGATRRVRRSLVVAEVALAVTTLSGAGMLLRSLWHLQGENLGFDPRGVLTAKVALLQREYDDRRTAVFYSQLESRLSALPGVRAAGASGWLAVVDAGGLWGFRPENGNYPEGRWPSAVPQQATPGYFAAAGLPLIAGRVFTNADVDGAPLVAVVSKAFADLAWPGQNAIGRRFGLATDMPFMTVVGIVGDIRARGFGDTPEPTMFFPLAQSAKSAYYMPRNMALLVRTSGDPALLAAAVRREIHALDPTVPVAEVRTLEEVAGTSVSSRRFNTSLLAGFAALALLLAGIGTYGVISYGVTQRTFEIGVRIALGADTRSVLGLIMAEGMLLAGTGLLLGLGASIAVARFLRAMLVGVAALDPPSMIATAAALIAVAGVASGLPARRALRVNPINALRGS
jgi:predicted permease